MNTLDQLREHWRRLDDCLNMQPASALEIQGFEERYQVKLPALLREYFLTLNGTKVGAFGTDDGKYNGFWHLDQIRTLAEEFPDTPLPGAGHLFVFADCLLWSWAWAIHLANAQPAPDPVFIISQGTRQIAGSFDEFLRRYLAGDEGVLFP